MSRRKLKCEALVPVEALPRMPLFPGKRQRWLMAQRTVSASEEERDAALRAVFQLWTEIIPGPISAPEVVDASEGPTSSLAQPPALGFREPSRRVAVEFDYNGSATEMRWPTHVKRRRARVDPLCPMAPIDTMPIAVEVPEGAVEGDEVLPPLTDQTAPDPFAVLPHGSGTDAAKAVRKAMPAITAGLVIAGALTVVVLVSRVRGK